MENYRDKLDEMIFKKAIFETIRLWCISECEYSREIRDAILKYKVDNRWVDSKNEEYIKFSKKYTKFLFDYSIARNRLAVYQIEMLKKIFNEIILENFKFDPKIIDTLAIFFQDENFTPKHQKPISLVSKTIFLILPQKAILYDKRTVDSIKFIYPHTKIENFIDYFEKFEQLKEENKDNAMKIINEYLPKIKSVMLNYFRYYYEINNKEENEEAFKIMEDKEWLYQRSLDKYLWYLQPEINKKK